MRLNPFAFPSDTDFRFLLLILSVLGASLFIYSAVYFSVPATRDFWLDVNLRCWELSPGLPTNTEEFFNPEMVAAQAGLAQCRAPAERRHGLSIMGGVLMLLALAGLIYWTFPLRKIRRDKLVPLSPDDAPDVVEYLTRLCRRMDLPRTPTFLWNPLNRSSGGVAFGRWGQYYVGLTGGLVTQFYTDLPAFRAVVLHELAHLQNADVDKTYFAVSVWQAFLIAGLLPLLATIFQNDLAYIFSVTWRVIALAALVFFMRNAVLRTREMYADLRASLGEGSIEAISRVLGSLPRPKRRDWRILWQVHPDPASRRQVLQDPDRLFPMGFSDAFATGLAAAIALPNIITLMNSLLTGTQSALLASLVAVLIVAPVMAGVVGLGTWRTTFAALAKGQPVRGAGLLGVGLGLGILVGVTLSFTTVITSRSTETFSGLQLLFNTLWGILLIISLFLFVRWIAVGASAWLEVAIHERSPRLFYTLGWIVAGGVLSIWLGTLFSIRGLGIGILLVLLKPLGTFWLIVENPLTLILLVSLWAFPMAAWLGQKRIRANQQSSWAFLDSDSQNLTFVRQAEFRPRVALILGALTGLMYCVLLLLVRIGLRLTLPDMMRENEDFLLMFYLSQIAVAALFQVGAAAIVAGWVERLGALHGLFSAFIGGCVMSAGIIVLNLLFGGTVTLPVIWQIFSQVVNEGTLLALPVVWAVSVMAGFVRQKRARPKLASQKQPA